MTLDIVIPAHNEEDRIGPTLSAYRARFAEPGVRFIVAMDSCEDATAAIVDAHAAEDPRVESLEYPKLGKGGVIREAFRRCDADLIAFVDADGATPPGELATLVRTAEHADGAIASRRCPGSIVPGRSTFSREAASAVFAWMVRALFGLPFLDTQCGAKVIRRDVVDRLLPFLTARDFLFDVELLYLAHRMGYRVVEVPTIWFDKPGSRVQLSSDAAKMARSLLRLWIDHLLSPLEAAPAGDRSVGRGTRAA